MSNLLDYGPVRVATDIHDMTIQWMDDALDWPLKAEEFFGHCRAFALIREGGTEGFKFVGAVVFNNYRPWDKDIELNIYAMPNTMNKGICIVLSRFVFGILGCERCSLTIPRTAKAARKAAETAGFSLEGTKRRAWRGRGNALLYGMLKSECRWFDQAEWDKEQADEFGRERPASISNGSAAAAA